MINDIFDSCKRGGFRLKLDSSKETVVEGSSDNKLHLNLGMHQLPISYVLPKSMAKSRFTIETDS